MAELVEAPVTAGDASGGAHLRASDAERDQAIGLLKTAFVLGRLTRSELDLRAGQAYSARTWADLGALTADLFAAPAAAPPARTPPARPKASRATAGEARGVIAPALFAASLVAAFVGPVYVALLLALVGMVYFAAWLAAGARAAGTGWN